MTKKEAINKLLLNLLVVTPLGVLFFAGVIGWLFGLTLAVITAIIQVLFRIFSAYEEYNKDLHRVKANHDEDNVITVGKYTSQVEVAEMSDEDFLIMSNKCPINKNDDYE
jgi:hypothetical protein